jgi:hypothetical protein
LAQGGKPSTRTQNEPAHTYFQIVDLGGVHSAAGGEWGLIDAGTATRACSPANVLLKGVVVRSLLSSPHARERSVVCHRFGRTAFVSLCRYFTSGLKD